MTLTARPSFCALCTDVTADLVQRPLGKHDALVWICTACDTEPAREVRGPDLGYDVPERDPDRGSGATVTRFSEAANRAAPPPPPRGGMSVPLAMTPGFVLVRVPRIIDDKPIDAREARETLRAQPWYAEVRYLGSVAKYHLFERPDTLACAAARATPTSDPLAGLERYRVPR